MKLLSQFTNENQQEQFALIDFTPCGEENDELALKNHTAFKLNDEVARLRHIGTRQECYKEIDFQNNEDEYTSVVPLSVIPAAVLKKYRG